MPTYEYACDLCGHQMEVFQSILAERLVTCPACSKEGLRRLVGTGAGLIFKGSGFYQTDYKNQAAPKAEGGGSAEKPAAAGGGDSAAKPAATSSGGNSGSAATTSATAG